ncbi:TlpA disulfide reductase family protein [Pseudalkalibacillus sp. SCS-8]|uniref:TlpA disulfide reductase family protein n=1 Tax=Pseudalkalibacillus nanhaiensis TaxID=3115291 RepID=UPI0032DA9B8E
MTKSMGFSLRNLKTDEIVSLSDFEGKPVIIQFWVSWCPDCMRELPLLEQFYKSMRTDEIVILTIHVTGREGSDEQRDAFIQKNGITLPVLIDNGTEVYDQFDCHSVPTTILLDADHQMKARYTDKDKFQDILYGVSRLLAG